MELVKYNMKLLTWDFYPVVKNHSITSAIYNQYNIIIHSPYDIPSPVKILYPIDGMKIPSLNSLCQPLKKFKCVCL